MKLSPLLRAPISSHASRPSRCRTAVHSRSDPRKGKDRLHLAAVLAQDRERVERMRKLPWRERLADLKIYPWRFFVVYMVLWTCAGVYVIPLMKPERPEVTAALAERARIKSLSASKLSQ